MSFAELNRIPHRRSNPLLREWVLVSPHRMQRPWQGKVEKLARPPAASFDSNCYLCPGNKRAGGAQTPRYTETYVFDNDYPAMMPEVAALQFDSGGLLVGKAEQGICRVMCFSPRHDHTVPRMSIAELRGVVNAWVEQYCALGKRPWINHVQIFENRGEMMGASNPHPHCQIWSATSCGALLFATTICLKPCSRIPWDFTRSPPMAASTKSGTCTRTTFRRCCAPPRFKNSWWATNFLGLRSGTLRQRTRRHSLWK